LHVGLGSGIGYYGLSLDDGWVPISKELDSYDAYGSNDLVIWRVD